MKVHLSESLKEIIIEARKIKNVPENYYLRIGIQRGGCAGIAHQLGFDEIKENDDLFLFNGIQIIIDKRHQPFLQDLKISYTKINDEDKNLPYDGINFENPNAVRVCGCGNSFNVI